MKIDRRGANLPTIIFTIIFTKDGSLEISYSFLY